MSRPKIKLPEWKEKVTEGNDGAVFIQEDGTKGTHVGIGEWVARNKEDKPIGVFTHVYATVVFDSQIQGYTPVWE